MHRAQQSWPDPQQFNPSRWHQYQQRNSSKASPSHSGAASIGSQPATVSSTSSNPSSFIDSHTDRRENADGVTSSHTGSHASRQAAAPVLESAATSAPAAAMHGKQSTQGLASSNGSTESDQDSSQPGAIHREVSTAAAVPKQGMRPGSGNLLSGMGPNGAYIPFGAGPRNCIGTGIASGQRTQ